MKNVNFLLLLALTTQFCANNINNNVDWIGPIAETRAERVKNRIPRSHCKHIKWHTELSNLFKAIIDVVSYSHSINCALHIRYSPMCCAQINWIVVVYLVDLIAMIYLDSTTRLKDTRSSIACYLLHKNIDSFVFFCCCCFVPFVLCHYWMHL